MRLGGGRGRLSHALVHGGGAWVVLHKWAQDEPNFWGLRRSQLWVDLAGVSVSRELAVELGLSVNRAPREGSRAETRPAFPKSFAMFLLMAPHSFPAPNAT